MPDLDLSDPHALIDLLKDAILRKPVNSDDVLAAIKQVIKNYETQNRIFLIAAANAELPRIVRLMNFITSAEEELFKDSRLEHATTRELTKLYALAQANLLTGLDNVKKVADMRIEAIKAGGGAEGVSKVFDVSSEEELNDLAGLPVLDATSRDRVRKLVTGLADSLEKDNSIIEADDGSDSDD